MDWNLANRLNEHESDLGIRDIIAEGGLAVDVKGEIKSEQ